MHVLYLSRNGKNISKIKTNQTFCIEAESKKRFRKEKQSTGGRKLGYLSCMQIVVFALLKYPTGTVSFREFLKRTEHGQPST